MKKVISAAVAVLALSACGSAPEPVETVTVTVPVPESDRGVTATPDNPAATLYFGEEAYFNNNEIVVSVSEPVEAALADYYHFKINEGKDVIEYTVTLTNNSEDPINTMDVVTSATSGEQAANPVDDPEAGLFNPWLDVLPGDTVTFKEAWAVRPNDVFTLSVSMGFSEPVFYRTTINIGE